MDDLLMQNGLPALFVLSFLAATLLPLGSEWLLVLLLLDGHPMKSVVAVATLGNYLGACTTYAIGIWGSQFVVSKIFRITESDLERARSLYRRYGAWSLLFSWLPVIGDPLCLLGGLLKIRFFHFSALVFSGKLARYAAVAFLTATSAH